MTEVCTVCSLPLKGSIENGDNQFSTCDICHEYVCDNCSEWLSNNTEDYFDVIEYLNISDGCRGDFVCHNCIDTIREAIVNEL